MQTAIRRTCQEYTSNTSQTLASVLYTLKGQKINSVSPGVFLLYDGVHLDATGSITITETDGPWTGVIRLNGYQVILYDLDAASAGSTGRTRWRWEIAHL